MREVLKFLIVVAGVAETVRTNDGSWFDDDIASNGNLVAYTSICTYLCVLADSALTETTVGTDEGG